MKNFCIFADAVNYIEDNLCSDVTQDDIAAAPKINRIALR